MKVFKVWPDEGCNPVIEKSIENVMSWITEAELEEKVSIEIMEMTETEYDSLPEYMGP